MDIKSQESLPRRRKERKEAANITGVNYTRHNYLRANLMRRVGALRQAQGPGFCAVSEFVELAVKLRAREILAVCLHLP